MTDVTSPVQMEVLAEAALREYGRIDILINNMEGLRKDEYKNNIRTTITDTNLKAAFAIEQPDDVAISELIIRPTSSEL